LAKARNGERAVAKAAQHATKGGYLASGGVQRSQLAAITKVEGTDSSVGGATEERICTHLPRALGTVDS
jgi:hypothetical protein